MPKKICFVITTFFEFQVEFVLMKIGVKVATFRLINPLSFYLHRNVKSCCATQYCLLSLNFSRDHPQSLYPNIYLYSKIKILNFSCNGFLWLFIAYSYVLLFRLTVPY